MIHRTLPLLAIALVACNGTTPPADAPADLSMLEDVPADIGIDTAIDAPVDAAMDAPVDTGPDVSMADVLMAPDIARTQPESVLAPQRAGCMFTAGAWPAATIGSDVPIGTDMPIDHIFVLLQENRSFDSYYAHLPQGSGDAGTIEIPPAGWSNPDTSGTAVPPYHDTAYCLADLDHSWTGSHNEWDSGANDGFVRQNNPMGSRTMAYYDGTDLPFYYALASTFAIGDHYFCSLLGPTDPNRMFSFAATSFGRTDNGLYVADNMAHPVNQIFLELDEAGIDWREYAGGPPALALFLNYFTRGTTVPHRDGLPGLITDLAAGTVPPVAFIEPVFGGSTGGGNETDEHPPGTPMGGEQWVETIVRAIMASPVWQRSVLFITYDENGGFADHVPPPPACVPDSSPVVDVSLNPIPGAFDRYGFRVPFTVVSPYARPHYVSHNVYDHTSLLRFIEARFGLPALTARDANATPPIDMFDFSTPAYMTPPTLPASTYPTSVQSACNTAFPTG